MPTTRPGTTGWLRAIVATSLAWAPACAVTQETFDARAGDATDRTEIATAGDAGRMDAVDAVDATASPDGDGAASDAVASLDGTAVDGSALDAGTCALPLGGTCTRGMTCPAGDGCNTCSCTLAGETRCTRMTCASDAGDVTATDGGTGACRIDSDCRTYSSYCSTAPCACLALSRDDRIPRCSGMLVTCTVEPCRGRSAMCVGGACQLSP